MNPQTATTRRTRKRDIVKRMTVFLTPEQIREIKVKALMQNKSPSDFVYACCTSTC